ncbi:PEP/pyruvate-binding domain-containing protein [Chloracidobacterium validum]|uniref:Phosphoenolpyruvate synthase n=1 Tax=Chloracidobacterium validum TaxID=2821543 RepID=A0ABX8BC61_9BACT|nr:PEP/pyruvate-binding domain-containing protein [Chloracidobacterium validum]QUW04428.1 PEP/pyruvate-binding domain-containing protein [Chloracidobacterium validum]
MSVALHCVFSLVVALGALFPLALTGQTTAQAPVMDNRASEPDDPSAPDYVTQMTRADFDRLARLTPSGRNATAPSILFVINCADGQVYYANSRRFRFHSDFARATYLTLDAGDVFLRKNYTNERRRFLLGTMAWQPRLERFTYEFWEGDLLTPGLLAYAHERLTATFFAPLTFKANARRHEEIAAHLPDVPSVRAEEALPATTFLPLNPGQAVGILRLVEQLPPPQPFEREDIVIFKETPLSTTPLRGIIVTQPGAPLSHLNLLAKGWGIPNAYVKDADTRFRSLVDRWVTVVVTEDGITIEPAEQIVESERERALSRELRLPRADLRWRSLTDLHRQRAQDVIRFGAKSANLGEVAQARLPNVTVPRGFSIPFAHYKAFADRHGIEDRVLALLNDDQFHHDPQTRQVELAKLRDFMVAAPFDPALRRAILTKVRREYRGVGLFARSSTNAEDLPDFSGAGLYTTVPNVRDDEALITAIKTVWASIWNFEAFEAREAARIDHLAVYPAVLIQEGINADSAGVLVTTNPFDRRDTEGIYINAKRGLGLRVVEGRRVPEQIIYRPQSDSALVLTRADDEAILTFDIKGGLKEVPGVSDQPVLTAAMIRQLGQTARAIERLFGGVTQDIEWLTYQGRLYIVQARPFLERGSFKSP